LLCDADYREVEYELCTLIYAEIHLRMLNAKLSEMETCLCSSRLLLRRFYCLMFSEDKYRRSFRILYFFAHGVCGHHTVNLLLIYNELTCTEECHKTLTCFKGPLNGTSRKILVL
jgi:hypothetical protein